jgi:hypothetical protein
VVLNEVVGLVTNVVTILGLPVLIWSILLLVRQLSLQANQTVYESIMAIDMYFAENPDLRFYIYEGEALPSKDERLQRERVLAAADVMLTYFEHIVGDRHNLSHEIWHGYIDFMCDVYDKSPAIQHFLKEKDRWYIDTLKEVLCAPRGPDGRPIVPAAIYRQRYTARRFHSLVPRPTAVGRVREVLRKVSPLNLKTRR